MLKYMQGYLTLNGINIHYYRTGGAKPPFILLHGATDNGLCWTPVAEVLSDKYDVIMPDAQGHGLSDRFDESFIFSRFTEQVFGLVRGLDLKKPLIMGHSMGAVTAVSVAVEYPDLPGAMILEDPVWYDRPHSELADLNKPRDFSKLRNCSMEEIIADTRKLHPNWPDEEIRPWAQSKFEYDLTIFSRTIIDKRQFTELVPGIKCPTLLFIGENGIVTTAVAEKAAQLWRSPLPFRWKLIKGVGHSIRRENFKEFKQTLFDFLKDL
jgi:N-formylmaleamate deformylase